MSDPSLGITLLTSAVAEGSKVITNRLISEAIPKLSLRIRSTFQSNTGNFEPYLRQTFDRCCKIKTLINKSHPIDLLTIYVNSRFECGETIVDDYDLIDSIDANRRIVISGSGGGGKTIFMKYLWLSLYVNSKGRIPVFVELRKINDLSVDDLSAFIYHSFTEIKSGISREHFDIALEEGAFTLILDGFDELAKDKKDPIEKQILAFSRTFSRTNIVISSRPNDRFDAWQSFFVYKIQPLDVKQVCALIDKLDYDAVLKRRFISKIKSVLFQRHRSFLSNPLLATMMMLTFDQFADIPEKMFIFYEQAFDALFFKHDATKEGYKRDRLTTLTVDEFKKCLSYFCLLSYFDEKFEFSDSDINQYCKKMLKIEKSEISIADFIGDLTESICIIQREGLLYNFTHRSFQEYFASYCLSNFIDAQFEPIVDHFLLRVNDNVLAMLFEMNQDRVETDYLIPNLMRIDNDLSRLMPVFELCTYCKYLQIEVYAFNQDGKHTLGFHTQGRDGLIIEALARLYSTIFNARNSKYEKFKSKDAKILPLALRDNGLGKAGAVHFVNGPTPVPSNEPNVRMEKADLSILRSSGTADYFDLTWNISKKVTKIITSKHNNRNKNIDELLGIRSSR